MYIEFINGYLVLKPETEEEKKFNLRICDVKNPEFDITIFNNGNHYKNTNDYKLDKQGWPESSRPIIITFNENCKLPLISNLWERVHSNKL